MQVSRLILNHHASKGYARRKHGVKKVVPTDDVLERAYRRAVEQQYIIAQYAKIEQAAKEFAQATVIPGDLRKLIAEKIKREEVRPWDDAIAAAACRAN